MNIASLQRQFARMGAALAVRPMPSGFSVDVLRDTQGQPVAKTSHTLNPVPFLIHDPMRGDRYDIDPTRVPEAGIANVTATCLELLGFVPPDDLQSSLLRFR